jgi:hypothetical protein
MEEIEDRDSVLTPRCSAPSAALRARVESGFEVTTSTARVYKVRSSRSWAVATIREWKGGGQIDVQSDDGNYAYVWTATGTPTLREFLLDVEYDYFMGKTHAGNGLSFDFDATIKHIRETILDARKTGSLDKDEARARWNDIDEMSHPFNEDEFHREFLEFDWAYSYCDYGSAAVHTDDPCCRRFWDGPWAALIDYWRNELNKPRGLSADEAPISAESVNTKSTDDEVRK